MTVPELGTLEPVPIRDVWQHEANDLTPWLAEHVDLLAEALGMEDLEVEGIEVAVGGYKADLVCSHGESTLVVENFWTKTMEDLHQVDEIWRRKRTPQPRVLDELPQRLLQSRCGIRRCLRSPRRQPVPPRGGISTPGSRHRPSTACSTRDAARSKPLSE